MAAFLAATRQGLALIGPSTAARFGGREQSVGVSNSGPLFFVGFYGAADMLDKASSLTRVALDQAIEECTRVLKLIGEAKNERQEG